MSEDYHSRQTQEEKKLQDSSTSQPLTGATDFVVAIENVELVDHDRRQMNLEQHLNNPYQGGGGGQEDAPIPFYAEYYYPYGSSAQQQQQTQPLLGGANTATTVNSASPRGPFSSWYTQQTQPYSQTQPYIQTQHQQHHRHQTTPSHGHPQPPLLRRSSSNPQSYGVNGGISSSQKIAPIHPLKRQKPKDVAWEDAPESAALLPKSTFAYGAVGSSKPNLPPIVDTTPRDFGGNQNKRSKVISPERNNAKPIPKPVHRRSSSDNATQKPTHKRSHSEGLPPMHSGRPFPEKLRNQARGDRSFYSVTSPNQLQRQHSYGHHRRSSSLSVATDASYMSFVSDIRKSTFFTGFNNQGDAELHYPFENIQLSMDPALKIGVLYQVATDPEVYEAYHLAAAAAEDDDDDDDFYLNEFDRKGTPTTPSFHLPAAHYVMSIPCDLYRRVMDEMADSRILPCGLFFCGHHEDVRQPSILLAAACVVLVLCGMGVVAVTFC